MGANLTSDFDILIQISESEINNQIQTLFLNDELGIPSSFSLPLNIGGLSAIANVNLGMPELFLDQASPIIRIDFPVENSQLTVFGIPGLGDQTISGLGGEIIIQHPITIQNLTNAQRPVLDFSGTPPDVSFSFDAATIAILTPLLPLLPGTVTMSSIITQIEAAVVNVLVTDVILVSFSESAIPTSNTDPLVPSNISVRTLNDTSAADRDALVFAVDMNPGSPGNLADVTTNFIPMGENSVVMLGNNWLLGEVIRRQLSTNLGIPLARLSPPLFLNSPTPAPGGQGVLTALTATVENNRIRVTGEARDAGTGWNATATFEFFISLTLVNGEIVVSSSAPVVNTDVDIEWWVILLTLGLGALFGGIVGLIVGGILIAVLEAVVEGIANNMISNGITSGISSIPTFPLGPIGDGLAMSTILLDDLELRGSITKSYRIAHFHSGSHATDTAFSLDLETGTTYPYNQASSNIDLKYHPVFGVKFVNGSKFSSTGLFYGAVSPIDINQMALNSLNISKSSIPSSFDIGFFSSNNEKVVGIRTNRGRMAKAKLYKNLNAGGKFTIEWITYDTATPSVNITSNWRASKFGDRLDPILVQGECCPVYLAEQECNIEAIPRKLAYPLNIQWCVDGTTITQNSGSVTTKHGPLDYKANGRFLTLKSGMGQKVDSSVCISIIDALGIEIFKCIQVTTDGTSTDCPSKRIKVPTIYEYLPVELGLAEAVSLDSALFKKELSTAVKLN